MGVKITALPAVGDLTGVEILPGVQSSTAKRMTLNEASAFAIDVLMAASTATPTSGDNLVTERSGAEKRLGLDAVSSYAIGYVWGAAAELTPALTGDKLLVRRSSTTYWMNVDTLVTYATGTFLTSALGSYVAGLAAATLADSDIYLVVQGATAKKTTYTDIAARVYEALDTYLASCSAVTAPADADLIYCSQSGTGKKLTLELLADYMLAEIAVEVVATAWDAAVVSPALGTDVLVCERSSVPKTVTAATLGAYTLTLLSDASSASPIVDADVFPLFRSGTEKTITAALLADYMSVEVLADASASPVTTFAAGDLILFGRSGVITTITKENMITEVLTGVQATVLDIDSLPSASPLDGTELAYVMDGATPKQATWAQAAAYVHGLMATYVGDQANANPIVDTDLFPVDRSDAMKYITAANLATYMLAEHWDQTAGTTVADADQFIMYRSGTGYRKVTGQMIETYISGELGATLLDFSTLATGTIAGADYVCITQTTTPKKATVTALTAFVWDSIQTSMEALNAKASPVLADVLLIQDSEDSDALKRIEIDDVVPLIEPQTKWRVVPVTSYTTLPASTSRITMSDTSLMFAGRALRCSQPGGDTYAVIAAVSANTYVDVRGAPLTTGVDITELAVGAPAMTVVKELTLPGAYMVPWHEPEGTASEAEMLLEIAHKPFRWKGPPARLVGMAITQGVADGVSQPYIGCTVEGHVVFTENSSKGPQLSGTPGTWVISSLVAVDEDYYVVEDSDDLEVTCDATDSDGDADTVSIELIFVLE